MRVNSSTTEADMTTNPFEAAVVAWINAREWCEHYHGIKDNDESIQCSHPDQRSAGDWCRITTCPLLRKEADQHGVE